MSGLGLEGGSRLLYLTIFAVLGAIFKSLAVLEGSRAALVDLLTCVANIASIVALVYALRMSTRPPDIDHPYGHARYEAAGALWVSVIYGFVAGYAAAELASTSIAHSLSITASLYVAIGTLLYVIAILVARRLGLAGRAYAAFTLSEVYEGIVVLGATLGGSLITPLVDYVAAWGLFLYLLYELLEYTHNLTCILTERVPPELVERVKKRLEQRGLRVVSLRLRPLLPGEYVGDAVVRVRGGDIRVVHELVDAVEREVRTKCRVHLVIHYEPE